MRGSVRHKINKLTIVDSFNREVIQVSEVIKMLDEIETGFVIIRDRLKEHISLSEINEIYELAVEYSGELY